MTTDELITGILRREGGYTVDERGGPTNFGITQRAWTAHRAQRWWSRATLPVDVKDLEERHARHFYDVEYVDRARWIMNKALRALFVDTAVNHGRSRAVRWLQTVAGVVVDGSVGPKTRLAVNHNADEVYRELLRSRFRFYAEIATDQENDPDAKYLRGWINRGCEFIR